MMMLLIVSVRSANYEKTGGRETQGEVSRTKEKG